MGASLAKNLWPRKYFPGGRKIWSPGGNFWGENLGLADFFVTGPDFFGAGRKVGPRMSQKLAPWGGFPGGNFVPGGGFRGEISVRGEILGEVEKVTPEVGKVTPKVAPLGGFSGGKFRPGGRFPGGNFGPRK